MNNLQNEKLNKSRKNEKKESETLFLKNERIDNSLRTNEIILL